MKAKALPSNTKKNARMGKSDIALIKFMCAIAVTILVSLTLGDTGKAGELRSINLNGNIPAISIPFLNLTGLFEAPEVFVYMIFGLLHTFWVVSYEESQIGDRGGIINFVAEWMLNTAFYRLVLLPACGFGYIEWCALSVIFALEYMRFFATKSITKSAVNPLSIVIFGVFLWMLKIILRYALKSVGDAVTSNDTLMNLATVMVIGLGVYGIKNFFQALKLLPEKNSENLPKNNASAAVANVAAAGINVAGKAVKACFNTIGTIILSIVKNPMILLIILVGVVLAVGGTAFVFVNKVEGVISEVMGDIKTIVYQLISFTLETDKASYSDDVLNTIGCIAGFGIYILNWYKQAQIRGDIAATETDIITEQNEIKAEEDGRRNRLRAKSQKQLEEQKVRESNNILLDSNRSSIFSSSLVQEAETVNVETTENK